MMGTEVVVSHLPKCDMCADEGKTILAAYDAKTKAGPWANMCQRHFDIFGLGLGTGYGQRLIIKEGQE